MRWVVIRFDIYHPIELEIWNSIDQKQINTIIPLMIIHLEIKRQNVLVYKLKLQVEISLQWTNERMFFIKVSERLSVLFNRNIFYSLGSWTNEGVFWKDR